LKLIPLSKKRWEGFNRKTSQKTCQINLFNHRAFG
jgi:hypothetical protein